MGVSFERGTPVGCFADGLVKGVLLMERLGVQRIAGKRRLKMAERREERMRAAAEVPR